MPRTTSVRLDEKQLATLAVIAKIEGSSVSALLREGSEQVIAAHTSDPQFLPQAKQLLADLNELVTQFENPEV